MMSKNLIVLITIVCLQLENVGASATLSSSSSSSTAFQSFFNFMPKQKNQQQIKLENQLLDTINSNSKRLDNSVEINSIVEQLEQSNWGIAEPAISSQVKGRWRLLHTNNAETASPIQRKAVDASKYNIYQDIVLRSDTDTDTDTDNDNTERLIVSQVVKFGDKAQLAVDALASTSEYPLEELTARKGTGKILGINILGVSKVGDEAVEDVNRPNSRILFVFDEGNFNFDGFKVPYPVPFRLPIFRDAVKGWIDITYLSDRIRVSRGNKGTTFVLLKEDNIDN
jgi:hypothetical protein